MLDKLKARHKTRKARKESDVVTEIDAESLFGDPSRAYPGRIALFWIRFVNRHLGWTHFAAAVVVFGVINLILAAFPVTGGSWVEWLRELVVAAVAVFIPILGTVAALSRPLRPMLRIVGQSSGGAGVIVAFFGDTFMRMGINLVQLRDGGAQLEPWQVTEWVRRCFKAATGQYVGTDSHLPGQYERLYSDYLAAHEDYLTTTKRTDSVRIVLVDVEQLRTDRNRNPDEFNTFMQWHAGEPVALLRLSAHDNDLLIEGHSWNPKLTGADIGFWRDNFALLFERPKPKSQAAGPVAAAPNKVRVWLAIKGEPLYDECVKYVDCLLEATHHGDKSRQADVTAELPIYSNELSKHWRQFCDPKERIKGTGRLLEDVLGRFERQPEEVPVFDAATGVGIEATYLLKKGYFLIANELEPALRQAAQEYAEEEDTYISEALFTRLDWLTMSEKPPRRFQAVYVLGNSLCHLESIDQVNEVLKNFYQILNPGGVLICDERNFSHIVDNWDAIRTDPWNNFRFNTREKKVMYHGTVVMGAPMEWRDGRIVFKYAEVVRKGGRITPTEEVGELSMLPFGRGELHRSLRDSGFGEIEVYCDLVRAPQDRLDDDADFFTYVAVKPG